MPSSSLSKLSKFIISVQIVRTVPDNKCRLGQIFFLQEGVENLETLFENLETLFENLETLFLFKMPFFCCILTTV